MKKLSDICICVHAPNQDLYLGGLTLPFPVRFSPSLLLCLFLRLLSLPFPVNLAKGFGRARPTDGFGEFLT